MRKYWLLIILSIFLSCNKNDEDIPAPYEKESLEPVSTGEIVKHTYYSLAYSEENEQALWVYYILTSENINGTEDRADDFREDPLVKTGSASLSDYKYSGYDRGHLCPAADMRQNKTAMSETFYLSNISPQLPGFNRGIWSSAEDQVREWGLQYKKVYVITGPIFKDNKGVIGDNEVTIPGYYFKIVFDGKDKMIALIIPNESSSKRLDQFVVTVDRVEQQTGINFFSELDDNIEEQLEGNIIKF